MKKCNVCNAVQEKDGLFCEKCGSQYLTTVEDVVDIKAEVITDQPKSSPLNQKLVILLGSAVAVLLVAAVKDPAKVLPCRKELRLQNQDHHLLHLHQAAAVLKSAVGIPGQQVSLQRCLW